MHLAFFLARAFQLTRISFFSAISASASTNSALNPDSAIEFFFLLFFLCGLRDFARKRLFFPQSRKVRKEEKKEINNIFSNT